MFQDILIYVFKALFIYMKYIVITWSAYFLLYFLIARIYIMIEKRIIKKYNTIKPIKLQKHNEIIYERKQRSNQYKELLELNQTFLDIIKQRNISSSERKINLLLLKDNRIFIFNFLKICLFDDINHYISDILKHNEVNVGFNILIQRTELTYILDEIDWKDLETEILKAVYKILKILSCIANEMNKINNNIRNQFSAATITIQESLWEWCRLIYLLKYEGYKIDKTMHMYEFYVDFYYVFEKYLDCIDILEN